MRIAWKGSANNRDVGRYRALPVKERSWTIWIRTCPVMCVFVIGITCWPRCRQQTPVFISELVSNLLFDCDRGKTGLRNDGCHVGIPEDASMVFINDDGPNELRMGYHDLTGNINWSDTQKTIVYHDGFAIHLLVDTFLTCCCALRANTKRYSVCISPNCGWQWSTYGTFIGCADSVISLCWCPTFNYAHIVLDIFVYRVCCIPDPLRLVVPVVLGRMYLDFFAPAKECAQLVGVSFLGVGPAEYVFARKVFLLSPMPWHSGAFLTTRTGVWKFRRLADERWRLFCANPSGALLFNRNQRSRNISDAFAMFHVLRENFAGSGWSFLSELPNGVRENARLFSLRRFIAGPHGAGFANVVFMHVGSGYSEFAGDQTLKFNRWDCFVNLSRVIGIHAFLVRIPEMSHWVEKGGSGVNVLGFGRTMQIGNAAKLLCEGVMVER